jgi:hypothetical protein
MKSNNISKRQSFQNSRVNVTDNNAITVPVTILANPYNSSISDLFFEAFIPAAGFNTYFLEFINDGQEEKETKEEDSQVLR